MIKTRWGLGLTGAVALGVIGLFRLGASGNVPFGFADAVLVQPDSVSGWVKRIALVDEALGRADLSRATYQWREAYGAAVRSGGYEGLTAVGDRAIRIAEMAGGSSYFRTEAGYVYVHAALRARAERSREAILGIAGRFDKLGDLERATQVRRIAANLS